MYPYCPKYLNVFWDNGKYVALDERDRRNGQLPYNLAINAQTKRDAILQAREVLGLDNSQFKP